MPSLLGSLLIVATPYPPFLSSVLCHPILVLPSLSIEGGRQRKIVGALKWFVSFWKRALLCRVVLYKARGRED